MTDVNAFHRLDALRRTGLLDSPAEERFDGITRLAAALLGTPVSLVSLVDHNRQFFKSAFGLRQPWATLRETPLSHSFCQYVVESGKPFVVHDARVHPLVSGSPAIEDLGVRAYAGVPLVNAAGDVLGALCVIDSVPRIWSDADVQLLEDLSASVTTEIALRTEIAERTRLQRALEAERGRLAALFEQAPAFIAWSSGPNHVFEGANQAYYKLVGFHDIIGKPAADVLPELGRKGLIATLDRVLATGEPFVAEGMRVHFQRTADAEPEERFVNFVYQPLVEADGSRTGIFCLGADVTEQVRAASAMRESAARHRQVLDALPVIVYRLESTPPHKPILVNRAVEMLGYPRDEWLSRADMWLRCMHPDDRARMMSQSADAWSRGVAMDCQYRMVARDGSVYWFRDSGEFLLDESGQRSVWQGIMQDITSQRDHLEASAAIRFQARLLDTVEQAVIATDVDGIVTYWNAFAERLYGWTSAEAVGQSIMTLTVIPETAATSAEIMVRLARSESWSGELLVRRKNGDEFLALITNAPIFDAEGRLIGIVGVSMDTSERRHLEEQLRQSQKMEAVGRLAGGIAHDFNNLLTVIKVSTDLLLEESDAADPGTDDLRQIAAASERAAGLTRQLLSFSRKQMLDPKVVALNEVVHTLGPMLARLIGEDVMIDLRLADGLGNVMADVGQLEQVLVNLAVNARDAMPNGGRIIIETADVTLDGKSADKHADDLRAAVLAGEYVMLSVCDTGIGMSAEVRARAFEPFFTTKQIGKGTGLGLSTVYGIVEQSGGHILLESEPGAGTVFRIYFPRLARAAVSPVGRAENERAARGSETILLVEDDEQLRGLARRILERQGYTVLQSCNGREALAQATRYAAAIHLILTDVVMPEMGGRALVEQLRDVRPQAGVIYMSGYTDDDVPRRGMLDPRCRFMRKPFASAELLRTVREVLDQRA